VGADTAPSAPNERDPTSEVVIRGASYIGAKADARRGSEAGQARANERAGNLPQSSQSYRSRPGRLRGCSDDAVAARATMSIVVMEAQMATYVVLSQFTDQGVRGVKVTQTRRRL
jgi:hypothetical protein